MSTPITRIGWRSATAAAVISMALLAVSAVSVRADSSTIAGEPTITAGQEEFGNFTGDTPISDVWVSSYWGLRSIAGDHVSIAFSGDSTEQGAFTLYADRVGTPDGLGIDGISFAQVASKDLPTSLHATLHFTAPVTGTMPLAFTTGTDYVGPYDFTATVLHRCDMQLPGVHRVASSGHLRVQAHDPDGLKLTVPRLRIALQDRVGRGRWRTVGYAAPRNGIARIAYHLPRALRGHVVQLRARASGGGYFRFDSATRRVRVR